MAGSEGHESTLARRRSYGKCNAVRALVLLCLKYSDEQDSKEGMARINRVGIWYGEAQLNIRGRGEQ